MPARIVLLSILLASPTCAWPQSQAIQRCQAADGSISYSNATCPPGSRSVRALAPAVQPTPDAQEAARDRAQRERDVAKALTASRQGHAGGRGEAVVPVDEARRAVDCAYLRGELDANRRLRNVLTTRPYYSLDDVEQMDAREAVLIADYRRHCTR